MMTILLDLYDRTDLVSNMIALYALQPVRIYYVGEIGALKASSRQEALKRAAAVLSPDTVVDFILVNPFRHEQIQSAIINLQEQYGRESMVVDLSGGQEILLFQMGRICGQMGIQTVVYRPGRNALLCVCGSKQGQLHPIVQPPTLPQMFAAAGCARLRYGHIHSDDVLSIALPYAETMLELMLSIPTDWHDAVVYFQKAIPQTGDEFAVTSPTSIRSGDRVFACPIEVLLRMRAAGMITQLGVNSHICSFHFQQSEFRSLFADQGIWLEIAVYTRLQRSGLFHHISIDAVVCWDNDADPDNNVENEIDVIATRGMGQLFISCKTGIPDTAALNELAVLVRRFGSRYACGMLVTTQEVAKKAKLRLRAAQLGLHVIDRNSMPEPVFMKALQSVMARWGGII